MGPWTEDIDPFDWIDGNPGFIEVDYGFIDGGSGDVFCAR